MRIVILCFTMILVISCSRNEKPSLEDSWRLVSVWNSIQPSMIRFLPDTIRVTDKFVISEDGDYTTWSFQDSFIIQNKIIYLDTIRTLEKNYYCRVVNDTIYMEGSNHHYEIREDSLFLNHAGDTPFGIITFKFDFVLVQ